MTQPPGFESPAPQPTPPHVGQPQAAPKPQPPVYEFTVAQNDVIRTLSRKMKFVGVFYVLASVVVGLAGLISLFFAPIIGVIYMVLLTPELLIGIWTINAASSFRLIVDTRGHDIPHLMHALTSLRKLYTLMFWLLIIVFVLMIIAVAVVIFLWSTGMWPTTAHRSTYTGLVY
jgi:hypothetical protein